MRSPTPRDRRRALVGLAIKVSKPPTPLWNRSVADVDRPNDRAAVGGVTDHAVPDTAAAVVAVTAVAAVVIRTRCRQGAESQTANDSRAYPTATSPTATIVARLRRT